jgi:putative SOS response-associated peptidase YedK
MCTRYSASKLKEIRALGSRLAPGHNFTRQWHPIYNIPPKSNVPVVLKTADHPLTVMRWGTWTADGLLVNVPFDSITEKPMWKSAAQRRRCLLLADGFFAWETVGERKFGNYFSVPVRDAFPIAGLWFPANEDQPERCLMVTTQANSLVSPFDDRMPAILTHEDAIEWLGDQPLAPEVTARLCQPYPAEKMSRWHSPPEINRADFQEPVAIRPWHSQSQVG